MSIIIPDYSGLPPVIQPPTLAAWRVTPQKMHFFWLMGTGFPANYNHKISYSNFQLTPLFSEHQDWLFEAEITNDGTIPLCYINGSPSYSGSLGIEIGSSFEKNLPISFLNFTLLSAGNYQINIQCKVTALNPITGLREIVSQKALPMTIYVRSNAVPAPIAVEYPGRTLISASTGFHSPLFMYYSHLNPIPTAEIYYFTLPSTITPPEISVSDATVTHQHVFVHPYFSKIVVSFTEDINAFLPNTKHTFNITINGLQASIWLNIAGYVDPDESLFISPANLDFLVINAAVQDHYKEVYVNNVINPWSIVGNLPPWLQVSEIEGTTNATLIFSIVNFENYELGIYSDTVTFVSGDSTVELPVSMELRNFLTHNFTDGRLSFCDDLDYIYVLSQSVGTFVKFSFQIKVYTLNSNEPILYDREYAIDLFSSRGEFHLGTVVGQLLEELDQLQSCVPQTSTNFWKNQFLPAEITGTWKEFEYEENSELPQELYEGIFPLIKMLPGRRPFMTNSQMGLLTVMQQEASRITTKSAIAVGFCHFGQPQLIVKRNNEVIDQFIISSFPAASGALQIVYSYFRFNNEFAVGDTVEILVANENEIRSQRYIVMPEGPASTFVLFENKNGIIEPFELTGRRRTNAGYSHTFASKYKDLFVASSKQSSEISQNMIVNTGKLLPPDVALVSALTSSLKVWVSYNNVEGPYLRATVTSNKMQIEDSIKSDISYDLEINLLENSNAILYPR